jgi:hypothetical protein
LKLPGAAELSVRKHTVTGSQSPAGTVTTHTSEILLVASTPHAPSSLPFMMSHRKIRAWLPAILWAGMLFFLSAQSILPAIAPSVPNFDKVEHFGAYGLLGILVFDAVRRTTTLALPKAALVAILITSAYGASDEFHQSFVPNRSCDVWDWTADTFGGILGVVVFTAYESRRSQKASR